MCQPANYGASDEQFDLPVTTSRPDVGTPQPATGAERVHTQEVPTLIDAPETRRSLARMAARLTSQTLWQEDLIQEALIHLWQEERRRPGQSLCWYLRSCQFHLLNQMRRGRSVDSPKRRNGHVIPIGDDNVLGSLAQALPDLTTREFGLEAVMARDLWSALAKELTTSEREILTCLSEGLGARETARRLNVSHTGVLKKRRRIALLLIGLEPETGAKRTEHAERGKRRTVRRATRLGIRVNESTSQRVNEPGSLGEIPAAVSNFPPELLP